MGKLTLGSILALLLLAGCKNDDEGTLRLTFKGTFENDPLVMFAMHDYANGQRLQFTRSEFFISDITLIDDTGEAHPLSDIELIDLTKSDPVAAQAGVVMSFDGIPTGNYQSLRFGFGVASDINATTPSDYGSTSPLSNAGRYWVPWSSFIFSKTEGNLDTLVDGTDNADLGFAYHTGTDDLFKPLVLSETFPITDGAVTGITLYLDHAKLMGLPGNPIDIKAKPQNHNPSDIGNVQAIANHVETALSYSID